MLIPRVLAAGAAATPADGAGDEGAPAAEARPGERLAALDRGRLLGLMQDRTSSHLMEARSPFQSSKGPAPRDASLFDSNR